MKTYIFLLAVLLSGLSGCEKNQGLKGTGYPNWFHVYFHFPNLSAGDVEVFNDEWEVMKTVEVKNETYFGYLTVGGIMEENIPYDAQPLELDYYHLLRINGADVDTLHVYQTYKVDEEKYLKLHGVALFYNNELMSSYNWLPYNTDEASNQIYYFEDGEIVNVVNSNNLSRWLLEIPVDMEAE